MKKILVLLGIISLTQISAMAYLNENETATVPVLNAQGYSRSTLETMDLVNRTNKGIHSSYARYYQPKRNNFLGRSYQNLKEYVDPSQDDGNFGKHQIEFSNTWKGMDTFYSSDLTTNKQVESL